MSEYRVLRSFNGGYFGTMDQRQLIPLNSLVNARSGCRYPIASHPTPFSVEGH